MALLLPAVGGAQQCKGSRGGPVPRVLPAYEKAAFWVTRLGPLADKVLLPPAAIRALDQRLAQAGGRGLDLLDERGGPPLAEAQRRWAGYQLEIAQGTLVPPKGGLAEASRIIAATRPSDGVRVVASQAHLRCIPTDLGLFRPPVDREFDRNQCSGLHFGEPVHELGRSGPWSYVRTESGSGWVRQSVLGPTLGPEDAARYGRARLAQSRFVLADQGHFRLGTRFPDVDGQVVVPTSSGSKRVAAPAHTHLGPLPFTRRQALELAFSEYGAPYGWGDYNGHRDCSRLLLDVFATFGLGLGRNSFTQSQVASEVVAVGELGDDEKRRAIVRAGQRGLVLLYMPGHIMLYLGDVDGEPWALSALSEYVEPCAAGGPGAESLHRVDRVTVSDLELGRGTSRRAFIERITTLVVFGQ